MRMDRVVKFYLEGRRSDDTKLVAEDVANITDMGVNRSTELLGNMNQRALIIRTLHPLMVGFSYVMIDDSPKRYRLTTTRQPLKGNSMIVGEDIG